MARKILVADDSVTAQNMGRKILADAGYEVIAVNNGSAALKKIAELKPDLVILDVYMPGYSGLEVCQRLKESHETARIPVLLSVGKLEPFKPEEAQRVRADGYIVKPFEASELLSALAKLEDKVVPRSEPSRPGRFARAVAAAEETGRDRRNKTEISEDDGWKDRIAFPHQKTETSEQEKVVDEASFYNPMNRDLRTVVEKPAVDTVRPKAENQTEQPHASVMPVSVAEASVDVAALAPSGLPQDVTAEELTAIAAAAARIQMAAAAAEDRPADDQHQIPENGASGIKQAAPEPSPVAVQNADGQPASPPDSARLEDRIEDRSVGGQSEEKTTTEEKTRAENVSEVQRSDDTQEMPATMAASAESVAVSSSAGSRWTAVAVSLENGEAAISLDQEMQMAHAAFATAASTSGASLSQATAVRDDSFSPSAVVSAAAGDLQAGLTSTPQPEPAAHTEPAVTVNSAEPAAVPVAQVEARAEIPSPVTTAASEVTTAAQPLREPAQTATTAGSTGSYPEATSPAQEAIQASEVIDLSTAYSSAPYPTNQEFPAASPEAPISNETSTLASDSSPVMPEPESKLDPETVKNTAAAWASWRQIRDTNKSPEQHQHTEVGVLASAQPETNAKAVAAGAEQILEAVAQSSHNPSDVASIVDSVLADLRPKLMEEISRKMAEKK